MHAVQVTVTLVDPEEAQRMLLERIVPMVSQAPGFIAGYWLEPQDGKGASLVLFDSEENAQAMVDGMKAQEAQGGLPVTFDSIGVRGVLVSA
jgi:hypothetical protein